MRDLSASFDSPPPSPGSTFALPDADMVAVAWTDSSGSGVPSRPDKAKSLSGAMLALGAVLLLFVPVSGVFFLVAGGLGLTMASGAAPSVVSPKSTVSTNE
jgi:hypothetical protein